MVRPFDLVHFCAKPSPNLSHDFLPTAQLLPCTCEVESVQVAKGESQGCITKPRSISTMPAIRLATSVKCPFHAVPTRHALSPTTRPMLMVAAAAEQDPTASPQPTTSASPISVGSIPILARRDRIEASAASTDSPVIHPDPTRPREFQQMRSVGPGLRNQPDPARQRHTVPQRATEGWAMAHGGVEHAKAIRPQQAYPDLPRPRAQRILQRRAFCPDIGKARGEDHGRLRALIGHCVKRREGVAQALPEAHGQLARAGRRRLDRRDSPGFRPGWGLPDTTRQ